MRRITFNKFMEWLDEMGDNDIVGENASSHSCPVANFYKEYFNIDDVSVPATGYITYKGRNGTVVQQYLPDWANRLITEITCIEGLDSQVDAATVREYAIGAYHAKNNEG